MNIFLNQLQNSTAASLIVTDNGTNEAYYLPKGTNGQLFRSTATGFEFFTADYAGITNTNISNWNTAYGWGNHASAGYATTAALSSYVPTSRTLTINGVSYDLSADRSWSVTSMVYPGAGIAVSTGSAWTTSITDNSSNWNTAYSWGNHASAGYLTSITSLMVTTALGYTPYNATNPSGYTSNTGTVTSVSGAGTAFGLTLTGTVTTSGSLTLGGTLAVPIANITATGTPSASTYLRGDGTWATVAAGGLTNWTEAINTSAPNATTPVSSFIATNAASNVDAAFLPKGNGAILGNIPDNASTGGNKRGTYAVDLQLSRASAAQVASGSKSFLAGGERNSASGDWSVAFGYACTASGAPSFAVGETCTASGSPSFAMGSGSAASGIYSFAFGRICNATTSYTMSLGYYAEATLYGQEARAVSRFNTGGDQQISRFILSNAITGTAQTEIYTNGSSSRLTLAGTNRSFHARISVIAVTQTAGNGTGAQGDTWVSEHICGIKKIGSTTSLVGSVQNVITAQSDANMSTAVVTIDADDTNDSLRIRFTPPSTACSTTVTWVEARVELVEIGF